jgi:membrane protein
MIKRLSQTVWKAGENTFITHDGVEHAGYLSFMGLLSMFPFLVFIVALTGFIGDGNLGREFIIQLRDILPERAVAALLPRIDEIIEGPPRGLLTLSMLAAIWTASSVVEGYRTVLNRAYHVGTPPAYIWRRLGAIVQLLLFTFMIMISMAALFVAPNVIGYIEQELGIVIYANIAANVQLVSGLVLLIVVALAYYSLPNIKQNLRSVIPGAVVTVGLWVLAVRGARYYLQAFDQVSLIYGSLAGVIVALLFFYIINLIFIFGAEFNYQLIRAHGSRIEEKEQTVEGVEPGDSEG